MHNFQWMVSDCAAATFKNSESTTRPHHCRCTCFLHRGIFYLLPRYLLHRSSHRDHFSNQPTRVCSKCAQSIFVQTWDVYNQSCQWTWGREGSCWPEADLCLIQMDWNRFLLRFRTSGFRSVLAEWNKFTLQLQKKIIFGKWFRLNKIHTKMYTLIIINMLAKCKIKTLWDFYY